MPSQDQSPGEYVVAMLELLAQEAPLDRFEDVMRQAAAAGVDGAAFTALMDAKERALATRRLFSRRQQREAGLSALVDTARDLTLPYSLDALLKIITRRARLLLGLDMSWVSLHDAEDGLSRVRASDGHASAITVGFRIPIQGGVGKQAMDRSGPFWTPDYLVDAAFAHSEVIDEVVRTEGLHALMALPLQHEETTFGVLYAADRNVRHFVPDEISLMTSLADLAAVAIERTSLLERARAEVSDLARDSSRARDSSAVARRLHSTHSELIDAVLGGGDLHTLLDRAAAELDGTLLLRGVDGKDVAVSGAFPGCGVTEAGRADFERCCLDAHTEGAPVQCGEGLWVCPVTGGAENLGSLFVHHGAPPTAHQTQLLALVAQTVAVLVMMQRSTAVAEGQIRDELFHDLFNASQLPPGQLATRANRLAIDLSQPHVIVIARPEGGSQGRAVAWASSYAHRLLGLKYADRDRIVLLLPGSDPGAAARAVSRELTTVLGHPVTVGSAGPVADPVGVKHTYLEAERCLDALTALGGTGTTASPGELGFLGLLLSDRHDIDGFIASAIGPVLDYDSQQSTELLRTLESYFASGGSPTQAAKALHVHPNTVSRRLERISELLGGWQEPPRALETQLAMLLQRTRRTLDTRRRAPAHPEHQAGSVTG